MNDSIKGVTPKAQPWARGIESELKRIKRSLSLLGANVDGMPDADRSVYIESAAAQNLDAGTNGRVAPTTPVSVKYASSTGLFEVTVALSGLVRDGAIFGASFESADIPYEVAFDIPRYGVVQAAPQGQTAWKPFSESFSSVITTRPGVQVFNLYLYGVCTFSANSAAYMQRARLSVKAV